MLSPPKESNNNIGIQGIIIKGEIKTEEEEFPRFNCNTYISKKSDFFIFLSRKNIVIRIL
jgi:hypothetical protein